MSQFDCFNGDADGICALTQLRRAHPLDTKLITGVKRDVALLDSILGQVKSGDSVTVLDVSLDKNRSALQAMLERSVSVFYCDHHFAGEIPISEQFTSIINTAPETCTSMLINEHLQGAYLDWAVAGAFGDNLDKSATALAKRLSINEQQLATLQSLGMYLNYNGYGATTADLYFHPADLVMQTKHFDSALDFVDQQPDIYATLEQGYHDDMRRAEQAKTVFDATYARVVELDAGSWSRRVSGVYGNALANESVDKAHAVLTHKDDEHFVVSVRAPLSNRRGADEVCRQFESGGGRAAAAGINALPKADLAKFVDVFSAHYAVS